jgi:hypothetical protein
MPRKVKSFQNTPLMYKLNLQELVSMLANKIAEFRSMNGWKRVNVTHTVCTKFSNYTGQVFLDN